MRLCDAETVEQADDIATETLDGVRSWRRGGGSVPARVVAHDAETRCERVDLIVPHRQVGAEGIGEHQHGRAASAVDAAVNSGAVHVDEGFGRFSRCAMRDRRGQAACRQHAFDEMLRGAV